MPNDYFRFKQFVVRQPNSAMKVGTDGVLLGAWCGLKHDIKRVLDIGTGTGLVSLMIAQRTQNNDQQVSITGVDLDRGAVIDARNNFEQSPWSKRMQVVNIDINDYEDKSEQKYDLIVSNPPYFSDSLLPPEDSRTNARHNVTLSFDQLLSSVKRLLSSEGIFCVIIPADAELSFIGIASQYDLSLSKTCRVCPTPIKSPKRVLLELSPKTMCDGQIVQQRLIIEESRGIYTDEFIILMRDFYLKL